MFRTLHGSNRSATPGYKARTLLTGNPGGIGHGWLKRIFIQRRFNEREDPNDYAFVQAFVKDNPALIENDHDYIKNLEAEPNQALRRAYLFGDWDIFAGQFFGEIDRNVHIVKPFTIPAHWNRFGAYDYGFNHPAAFGWFANDEDGNTYLYRELIQNHLRVDQFAAEINKFNDTKLLRTIVAGLDCWTTRNTIRDGTPPTIAEEFDSHGIFLERASVDRIQGAAQLRSYLAWQGKVNKKPRFFFFENCPVSFDTVSRMIHNPDKLEDVLKVDATEGDPLSGDDAYDMVRYGLMSRPSISEAPKVYPKHGSPEYIKEQEDLHKQAIMERMQREKAIKEGNQFGLYKDQFGRDPWHQWND
jgi:phage terminase large subunit